MVIRVIPLFLMLALAAGAFAIEDVQEKPRRGLYWYEKPVEEPESNEDPDTEKSESKYKMPSVPEVSALMKWHPKDIRELFVEVHEYHVMKPTLYSAKQVQKIKAVMNKKARAAAAVEQLAILQNPSLSGVAENAVNPSARSVQRKERDSAVDRRLLNERGNFALIMLSQPGCGACKLQRNVIASFVDKTGWKVKEVNIIDNPAAKVRFNVQVTPTTLIASRVNGGWQTVAIGSETLPALTNNTYQAVRLLANEIKPEQWLTAPNQAKSLYDPNFK